MTDDNIETTAKADAAAIATEATAAIAAAATSATTAITHIETANVVSNELSTAKAYLKTAIEWIEAHIKAVEAAV
jgi:hypothetical protein